MKLTVIAARLRKMAVDLEVAAARTNDLDFPDEMVTPLIANAFTDDDALKASWSLKRTEAKSEFN
jgi:hypothetical protein